MTHDRVQHDDNRAGALRIDSGAISFPTEASLSGNAWSSRPTPEDDHISTGDGLAFGACAGGKQRYTLHLPRELIEQLRDAVYWTPGLTLASLAESALRERVERLSRARGGPFPPRAGELKPGRPLTSPSRRIAMP